MKNTRIVLSKPVFLKIAHFCRAKSLHISAALIIAVLMLAVVGSQGAQAQAYIVLYSFKGIPDGGFPVGGVAQDRNGNLYGTTEYGGTCKERNGCGTVFKLDTTGAETVLHSFQDRKDGYSSEAGVVLDWPGNIYGTSYVGDHCKGTAFKLNPTTGRFKVLHCFNVDTDGGWLGALIRDSAGNLYGTAEGGGGGVGLVFKLDKSAVFTILYTFTGGSDGGEPTSGLIRDAEGNLYGAANEGGDSKCYIAGCGTVFKLDTTGALTVLHTFHGKDGWAPFGPLARSPNGTLFGTTYEGGDFACGDGNGCGTVFKVSKTGKETVLHRFNGEDGAYPQAGLIRDKAGNLYGTTYLGGAYGYGTVFQLTPNSDGTWTESVLYSFTGGADGGYPYAAVMLDKSGNLYGTAAGGGTYGWGVVFKITP